MSRRLKRVFVFKGSGQHIKDVAMCHILENKDEGPASVDSKTIKTDEQGLFPILQHNGKDVAWKTSMES